MLPDDTHEDRGMGVGTGTLKSGESIASGVGVGSGTYDAIFSFSISNVLCTTSLCCNKKTMTIYVISLELT